VSGGSERRTRTVIDAAPGLGEAVVSGAVNPDHVVVEGDETIAEHRLGDKAVAIRGPRRAEAPSVSRARWTAPASTLHRSTGWWRSGAASRPRSVAPQDIE
jgi:hypothetical protein